MHESMSYGTADEMNAPSQREWFSDRRSEVRINVETALAGGTTDGATTRDAVVETGRLIRQHIRRTPVIEVAGEDFGIPGVTLVLKLELMQHAGAFKARGAFANLLLRDVPRAGVAAASGGNHGAAVAYAAKRLGHRAMIFVPEVSSPAKIARIRAYGAQLVISGTRYADALAACEAYVAETGALNVHAYDSAETILGAATLAHEFEEQAGGVDVILAPVGGGGLIAGLAGWHRGAPRVVGVEPEAAPCLHEALAAGTPVDAPAGGIAADSLGAKRVGAVTFPIAKAHVAASVLVSDTAIVSAQRMLWERLQTVAEPGGATAFAGLLAGVISHEPGARIGIVISGGNTVAVHFHQ